MKPHIKTHVMCPDEPNRTKPHPLHPPMEGLWNALAAFYDNNIRVSLMGGIRWQNTPFSARMQLYVSDDYRRSFFGWNLYILKIKKISDALLMRADKNQVIFLSRLRVSMGFLMVSEVTPFPGVTSDTKTWLVSPLLLIRLVQKFTKSFL